jgi:cytochrome c553
MKSYTILLLLLAGILPVYAQPAPKPQAPVSYPHAGQPLPDGILSWEAVTKAVDVVAGTDFARSEFSFTNVSSTDVIILSVHPSCGCTTAELPPVPWTIPAGSTGRIKVKVNLAGKSGTLFKTVNVSTDEGSKTLSLRINITPVPQAGMTQMTDAQRATGIAVAKLDRQAVFRGDCASCHVKNVQGSYGKALYDTACGICHEASPRASMVPDLHHLPVPTNMEFWRTWIASGKPGTLMPAFASSQGGPLNDAQIVSLAVYLNSAHPPTSPLSAK